LWPSEAALRHSGSHRLCTDHLGAGLLAMQALRYIRPTALSFIAGKPALALDFLDLYVKSVRHIHSFIFAL
jgi:hypothetical protein